MCIKNEHFVYVTEHALLIVQSKMSWKSLAKLVSTEKSIPKKAALEKVIQSQPFTTLG